MFRKTSLIRGAFAMLALAAYPAALPARTSPAVESYLAGDYARARIEWSALARQGDPVARFNVGMLFLQGLGVPREAARAEEYIREAAAAGYAPAQYQLALLLLPAHGAGNLEAAIFWLSNAARQGHPMAAWQLGRVLSGEYGAVSDVRAALDWLGKAEAAGIVAARQNITALEDTLPGSESEESEVPVRAPLTGGRGTLEQRKAFFEGQKAFIRQNYARAVEIWAPLAEAGVARAQYGIAFMLESGWGVEQDYAEAAYWYQLAAQKGHAKAQFNLGRMYMDARGTNGDRGIGLYWIQTAADRGEPRAREYMARLDRGAAPGG